MSDEEEMPIKIPHRKRKSAKPVEKKNARKKRKFTRIPKHNPGLMIYLNWSLQKQTLNLEFSCRSPKLLRRNCEVPHSFVLKFENVAYILYFYNDYNTLEIAYEVNA